MGAFEPTDKGEISSMHENECESKKHELDIENEFKLLKEKIQ